MKIHEYLAEAGQDLLLNYVSVAGMASQVASTLRTLEEPDMAERYLDVVQYITKLLMDEAKIRGELSGVLKYLSDTPVTLYQVIKDHPELLDAKVKDSRRKLFREVQKLVDEGKVLRVSERKYILAPPPKPASMPESETEPESFN